MEMWLQGYLRSSVPRRSCHPRSQFGHCVYVLRVHITIRHTYCVSGIGQAACTRDLQD